MSKSATDEILVVTLLLPSFFGLQKHFYTLCRSHTLRICLGGPRVAYSEKGEQGSCCKECGLHAGLPSFMHFVAHRPLCLAQLVAVHLTYIAFEQVGGNTRGVKFTNFLSAILSRAMHPFFQLCSRNGGGATKEAGEPDYTYFCPSVIPVSFCSVNILKQRHDIRLFV